jgi:hypothetical protein
MPFKRFKTASVTAQFQIDGGGKGKKSVQNGGSISHQKIDTKCHNHSREAFHC